MIEEMKHEDLAPNMHKPDSVKCSRIHIA